MPAALDHVHEVTPMGAHLVADGATFRVWAPQAHAVHVVGSFNDFTERDDAALVSDGRGGWHGFIPGVRDRDIYKFHVLGDDGAGHKRDPYARELTSDAFWNCIVRRSDFPWHETGFRTPAFHELVIYQLHTGAFDAKAWPTRAGTFLDVVARVPYIAQLGVTAVQLLPIQEFPGDFSLGYNGTDYFSPEMAFGVPEDELAPYVSRTNDILAERELQAYTATDLRGSMNQLKALVDICHAFGLAVIFDLVFNHAGGNFGTESLWFLDRQVGSGEDPPRYFNSLYFTDRGWAGGNVFNFATDGVRQFLIDNARFLVEEYRVDGFRYDEVSVIDHQSYGRGWDFCQDLTDTLRAQHPHVLQHAEYWPVNEWVVRDTAFGGAGFHSTMTDGPRIALRRVLEAASFPGDHPLPLAALARELSLDYLPARWRGVNSIENHDLVMIPKDASDHNRMDRIARVSDPSDPRSWYARSRARVATGVLLTMPGIPMLFMGQEQLTAERWTDDLKNHPHTLLDWSTLNDDGGDPLRRDFVRCVRDLLAVRRSCAGLRGEGFRVVHASDADRVLVFHRWVPDVGEDVLVVAHLGNGNRYHYRIGFPGAGVWHERFNSDVYDGWPNPAAAGNLGLVRADPTPRHEFAFSASLTLPANALLVFTR